MIQKVPTAPRRGRTRKAPDAPKPVLAGKNPATGQYTFGNQFWRARSSHGANPIFANAEELWNACAEYFEWIEANPLFEVKAFMFQGIVTQEKIPKMNAMTIKGLCLFLNVTNRVWCDWRANRPDLIPIITRVEDLIYQQKFAGAAADMLNANIIARDLGLADRSELTGADHGPIEMKDVTPMETARKIAFVFAQALEKKTDDT